MTEVTKFLITLSNTRFQLGYWSGIRQASVLVSLRLTRSKVPEKAIRNFDEIMTSLTTKNESRSNPGLLLDTTVEQHVLLSRLLNLTLAILNKIGMPVMGGTSAVMPFANNPQNWVVGLPAIAQSIRAPQAAFSLACTLMNVLANGKEASLEDMTLAISKLSKQYQPLAPRGINTLRFLQVAHEMGVPWRHVANNVYQFGWGSRSRWLDSSFTDGTSSISVCLARDKVACSVVLRKAGLPVAKHQLVNSAEQAVKVADALGYPVVVKPANLDGGAGVMVGLRDAHGVIKAFTLASKHSKKILVEQFVGGEDYRIRICTGEVIGAVIRKAAAVKGDGQHSVQELIEQTNAERNEKLHPPSMVHEHGTKHIVVDEEVISWLTFQGLELDSVVPLGQKVRLRGAANVNLGGTTWDVTEKAHPDNLELALRAAAALRLDVAGVDLLLPDIGQSWKATGGSVCEVNAQPQFSSGDAHRQVLMRLVRNRGRIPVVGILKPCLDHQVLMPMVQLLQKMELHVEVTTSASQCHQVLMRRHADALIWLLDELPMKTDALPVDEIDLLIHDTKQNVQQIPAQWAQAQQWVLGDSSGMQKMLERLGEYLSESVKKNS